MSLYVNLKDSKTKFRVGDLVQAGSGSPREIAEIRVMYRLKSGVLWWMEEELDLLTRPRPNTTANARRARGEKA
jgi:hypothetical protein